MNTACSGLNLKSIAVHQVRLRLQKPFITSFGRQEERDTILIVMRTHDDIVGVGETPSLVAPMYDDQYMWADFDVLQRYLIPSIQSELKGCITSIDDLQKVFSHVKGHRFAKCGIEAAYWNAYATQQSNSLATLWGATQDSVVAGFSIGGKTLADVQDRAQEAVAVGFKRLKIKIWPGFDVDVLRLLRDTYPDLILQVDANAAYDPSNIDHVSALKALDAFALLLIEQPFAPNRVLDHARFQAEYDLKTPICLDESILDLHDARQAYELWKLFDVEDRLVINVKPPRVGGYWESIRIAEYCQEHNIPCWVGGMLETGIGKWMNIILAAHPAFTLPGDHLQPQPYYERDIISPLPQVAADGTVALPSQGLGVIDWQAIEDMEIGKFEVKLS